MRYVIREQFFRLGEDSQITDEFGQPLYVRVLQKGVPWRPCRDNGPASPSSALGTWAIDWQSSLVPNGYVSNRWMARTASAKRPT